jgi:hypothetical protein
VAPSACLNATMDTRYQPTAASGAVNRLGTNTPAANPTAHAAASSAAPTATGHNGGRPQVA